MGSSEEWTMEDDNWCEQFKKVGLGKSIFFKLKIKIQCWCRTNRLKKIQKLYVKNERRIDELQQLTKEEKQMMDECEEFMKEVHADPVVMAAEVPTERIWKNIMSEIRAREMQKEGSQ